MKKAVRILVLASITVLLFVTVAPAGTVMDRILKRGELVVGTTASQPPMTMKSKTGQIIGLDAGIARLIARSMGVKVKFVTMPFSELLPTLESGKVDIVVSGMTMTTVRNMKVAFIGPYYISGKGVLTKTRNTAAIQNMDGLNNSNVKLAAIERSTSQVFVEKAAPKATLVKTKSYDEAIDLLTKDKVDALIADLPFCAFTAFRYPEKGLIAGKSRFNFEPLGIAVLEDTLLINLIQNFIGMLQESGNMKKLHNHWFRDGSWIKDLAG